MKKLLPLSRLQLLLTGIAHIHYEEGWFVIGAGRNGMEFNFSAYLRIDLNSLSDKIGRLR